MKNKKKIIPKLLLVFLFTIFFTLFSVLASPSPKAYTSTVDWTEQSGNGSYVAGYNDNPLYVTADSYIYLYISNQTGKRLDKQNATVTPQVMFEVSGLIDASEYSTEKFFTDIMLFLDPPSVAGASFNSRGYFVLPLSDFIDSTTGRKCNENLGTTTQLTYFEVYLADISIEDNVTLEILIAPLSNATMRSYFDYYMLNKYNTEYSSGALYEDGYQNGYTEGYALGRSIGRTLGRNDAFTYGTEIYNFNYYDSFDYIIGFEDGGDAMIDVVANDIYSNGVAVYGLTQSTSKDFIDGTAVSSEGVYEQGYLDGGNDSFMAGFDVWIVPAIIIVLIVGGYIGIRKKMNKGE